MVKEGVIMAELDVKKQVRNKPTVKRLELEYYYIENCSIWLDIKCIFKTIKVVLCRSGAK